MKCIIYVSRALHKFSSEDLSHLALTSDRKNAAAGITGLLCLSSGGFVQYLEGPTQAIDTLMAIIRKDPRHKIEQELELKVEAERIFKDWGLRCIHGKKLTAFLRDFLVFLIQVAGERRALTEREEILLKKNLKLINDWLEMQEPE